VIVRFADRSAALARTFPSAVSALERGGGLGIAYPKKSSRITPDVTFDLVQKSGLDAGLVDNKVAVGDR
jgi:hypothetical protein